MARDGASPIVVTSKPVAADEFALRHVQERPPAAGIHRRRRPGESAAVRPAPRLGRGSALPGGASAEVRRQGLDPGV